MQQAKMHLGLILGVVIRNKPPQSTETNDCFVLFCIILYCTIFDNCDLYCNIYIDIYIYIYFFFPPTFVSNLMMAKSNIGETCSLCGYFSYTYNTVVL